MVQQTNLKSFVHSVFELFGFLYFVSVSDTRAFSTCHAITYTFLQFIGCVIGKNGIKIRQIRDLSQAQIRISSPSDDPNRTISISGTPDAVSTAKYLINYQLVIFGAYKLLSI